MFWLHEIHLFIYSVEEEWNEHVSMKKNIVCEFHFKISGMVNQFLYEFISTLLKCSIPQFSSANRNNVDKKWSCTRKQKTKQAFIMQ